MNSEDLPISIFSASESLGNQNYSICVINNASLSDNDVAKQDVIVLLWHICGPILLLIGLVGNILVLVTMTRRRMRGTSTFVYLVGMAAIDLVVLMVGLLPGWLEGAEIVAIKTLHPAACKIQKFLDYASGDAAVWLRMAFTIDRLLAVLFPLYTGNCCGRPSSARIYVITACVVAVSKDLHVFWTRGTEYSDVYSCMDNGTRVLNGTKLLSNCGYPTPEYRYFELYVRPWIAFATVSVAPFAIIAICNTLIVAALVIRRHKMSSRTRQSLSTNRSLSRTSHEQQFFQMTAMCVAASGLFLVCTAPTIVMLIGKPYWNVPPGGNAAYEISRAVTGILFYVTFSANFFLYCLTGKRFRTTLLGLCRSGYSSFRSSVSGADRQSKLYGDTQRRSTYTVEGRSNNPTTTAAKFSANVGKDSGKKSLPGMELADIKQRMDSKEPQWTSSTRETAFDTLPADDGRKCNRETVGHPVVRFSDLNNTTTGNADDANDDVIRKNIENHFGNARTKSSQENSCDTPVLLSNVESDTTNRDNQGSCERQMTSGSVSATGIDCELGRHEHNGGVNDETIRYKTSQ